MVIAFLSIVVAVLLALYVSECIKYKALERDNQLPKEQRDRIPEPVAIDEEDLHQLDKGSAMEAIRFNGFMPEEDGNWITFMSHGERYAVDTERLPVLVMMRQYNLDHKDWDMDLMYKAAHQVSDEFIMAKVLFLGEDEEVISFQIATIENKYGHFKDCLPRYINIIDESLTRMAQIYNEMEVKLKENHSELTQFALDAFCEKNQIS